MRILIVDDDVKNLKSFEAFLLSHGLELILADSAQKALAEMRKLTVNNERIDLLLTDYLMPVINGLELAGMIREMQPDLPIIFMTAFGDKAIKRKAADLGCHFLEKPFSPKELHSKILEKTTVKTNNKSYKAKAYN